MDQTLNPYSPGAGLRPPALVGRDKELDLVDVIIERTRRGLHNRGVILHGLRGVGKTVILNEMAARAEDADWLVVQFEAGADKAAVKRVRARLARELTVAARKLSIQNRWKYLKEALPVLASFSASLSGGVSIDVEPQKGRGDSGDIGIDLEELIADVAAAAKKDNKGVAFFIDEMQDLDDELMAAIIAVQHFAGQRGLPFFVFGAGLPNLPQVLAESQSYAERLFEYRKIGALDDVAAKDALVRPALEMAQAEYSGAALQRLTSASQNYPYFLQEYGRAIWNVAPQSPFSDADAQVAVLEGTEALDYGFFPSRWERATSAEKRFLTAMAHIDGDNKPVSAIAQVLEARPGSLSTARNKLIAKGLIFAPEHGMLQFTVPGMGDFIRRQVDD